MSRHAYEFNGNFGDDGYQPYPAGRLLLASGAVVRIVFCKEGLKLLIPDECQANGDIVHLSTVPYADIIK